MNKKHIYFINRTIILLSAIMVGLQVQAQMMVKGLITSVNDEPLVGAAVRITGSTQGVITDIDGAFSLSVQPDDTLEISFIGFKPKTISPPKKAMHIVLEENAEELDAVIVRSETTFSDKLNPIQNQVILESELTKAACCNLSESFETNASVDVSFTDAVSGAKVIRMLGLDGRYVQINRENIPLVRGLSGRYGLGFVPGTWIQSIDVGKGAGSVVNGYESMVGQINLEYKKPRFAERLYLNAYVNSFGRYELNVNHAGDLNDRWSSVWLLHADNFTSEVDRNDDGFLDVPKSRQINFLNKYQYDGDRLKSQIGIHVMRDEKAGGQPGFDFGRDHQAFSGYGFSNTATRLEIFGKFGLIFPEKPWQGFGVVYSASYQKMDAGFGRREYGGEEKTLYGNVIYQNILGSSFHQYKTGVSFLYDDFDEVFEGSAFARTEIVPGAYFEYSYLPGDRLSLVLGNRLDFHNLYGVYITPRVHFRYQINDRLTARSALGRGYRTPNVITENINTLVSSRRLLVREEMEAEVSWNFGGSLVYRLPIGERSLQLTGDYFHTAFENQMIVDLDASSREINVYNLDGTSFAHSFQVESSLRLNENWEMKAAYKHYNVRTTINETLRQAPMVSKDRVFLNVAYAAKYDKWKADLTWQWIGSMRLPVTSDKPAGFQRGAFSPGYMLVNAQLSRGFKWGSIYLGGENLLDFRQTNPVIDAPNPFGDNFDASMVWGPVAGRLIYAGVRYKIKRNN